MKPLFIITLCFFSFQSLAKNTIYKCEGHCGFKIGTKDSSTLILGAKLTTRSTVSKVDALKIFANNCRGQFRKAVKEHREKQNFIVKYFKKKFPDFNIKSIRKALGIKGQDGRLSIYQSEREIRTTNNFILDGGYVGGFLHEIEFRGFATADWHEDEVEHICSSER